ncbi:hypothetical protein CEXT_582861 [Caerostris extrusa]|uniref:Uncharacterized protein n=1 Tax=Caerostris extrusa TaxID=172846 RepID=A0AAV4T3S2_CAEEX|nr:hypothetical protein CEXT_582861 [Caerostris extrusa]
MHFTNAELADIQFVYDLPNADGCLFILLYRETLELLYLKISVSGIYLEELGFNSAVTVIISESGDCNRESLIENKTTRWVFTGFSVIRHQSKTYRISMVHMLLAQLE